MVRKEVLGLTCSNTSVRLKRAIASDIAVSFHSAASHGVKPVLCHKLG